MVLRSINYPKDTSKCPPSEEDSEQISSSKPHVLNLKEKYQPEDPLQKGKLSMEALKSENNTWNYLLFVNLKWGCLLQTTSRTLYLAMKAEENDQRHFEPSVHQKLWQEHPDGEGELGNQNWLMHFLTAAFFSSIDHPRMFISLILISFSSSERDGYGR